MNAVHVTVAMVPPSPSPPASLLVHFSQVALFLPPTSHVILKKSPPQAVLFPLASTLPGHGLGFVFPAAAST